MANTWVERRKGASTPRGRLRAGIVCWATVLAAVLCGSLAQAAGASTVTKVSPNEGPVGGGTTVVITGTGLKEAIHVKFGGVEATSFEVESGKQITAKSPAHAAGTVNVVVETKEGKTGEESADQYTYREAPKNITPPVASPETPHQGATESASTGTWTNSPISYKYQWERCNGKECEEIKGATGATYLPRYKDVGKKLVVAVTAENAGGHATAVSAATQLVVSNGVTEYPTAHGGIKDITSGPDGNLWFTGSWISYGPTRDNGTIGKITTAGVITEYSLSSEESQPHGIVAGPDGNLWFTDFGTSRIGKITTSGTITEYSLPAGSEPLGIAAGSDGNLWFTEEANGLSGGKIGKITTSGTITEYSLPAKSKPHEITAGPGGDLWFTITGNGGKIGKITTSGTITEYALSACEGNGDPYGITTGSDGNVWFTETACRKIGKITPSGVITDYSAGSAYLYNIAAGPEGDLWFTAWGGGGGDRVGTINTSGTLLTEYALPENSDPYGITAGPDGNIWFADGKEIGKIEP
jgi:streptogramin lyase